MSNSFINKILPIYVKFSRKQATNIRVELLIAQACYGSSFGQCDAARLRNNVSGIMMGREFISIEDCVRAHFQHYYHRLYKPDYINLMETKDLNEQLKYINFKFNVDDEYGNKLKSIIEQYDIVELVEKEGKKYDKNNL